MSGIPHWASCVHHDSSEVYVSEIAPRIGQTVSLRIRVPRTADLRALFLRSRPDGEWKRQPMTRVESDACYDWHAAEMPIRKPHNNYCFQFLTADGSFFLNQYGASPIDCPDWFNFTILGDYDAPAWVREQVFYQIFPDRFANGDPAIGWRAGQPTAMGVAAQELKWGERPRRFQESRNVDYAGGDLPGLTGRLDYLVELGVSAIYLNPIFDAETNHYYIIRDFDHIAASLGGDAALAELRRAMDARGMKLVLDFTPNHIGFVHPWHTDALEDPGAESAEYLCRDPQTGAIEHWLGVPHLVKLNYASQKLRQRIYGDADSPIRKWLRPPYRIDGWRLDVANMTGNFWRDQLDSEVWREMRASIKAENPQAYMMGEYFQDSSAHLQGDELDASMNYQGFNTPTRRWLGSGDVGISSEHPRGDPNPLSTEAMAQQWQLYLCSIPYIIALQQFNQIGGHDISRPLRVAGGDKALVQAGVALLMGFPGAPCVYYADEIGMDGGGDPDNRRCMPWDERDWDADMLRYHQRVIAIRRGSPALQRGGFQLLHAEGDLIAFQRQTRDERMIVVAWRGQGEMPAVELDMIKANLADGKELEDLLGGRTYATQNGKLRLARLERGAALFLRCD